jgi:hypothetical protein
MGFKQNFPVTFLYTSTISTKKIKRKIMNTKFTILVAAGLLFAGVSQAQNAVAMNKADFNHPRHEIRQERHEVRKDRKAIKHNRHKKIHHHHKVVKHHHRKF